MSLSVESTQADVAVVSLSGLSNLVASQSDTIVIFNIPSETVLSSQSDVNFVSSIESDVQVSQLDFIAIMRGRVNDPAVRAWTFTLDGHDFYVLRLGNNETLVFDLTTEQWFVWGSGEDNLWGAYTGVNWIGGNSFASSFGSNILVGSDANGAVFFLDPERDVDSAAVDGRQPTPFRRRITAQLPIRGYDRVSLYEVQLIGSTGDLSDATLTSINLSYSDDRGNTYVDAGTITIPADDFEARANWLSLGSFSSPGRILRIEDTGSLRRVDSLTMNSDMGE